MLRKGERGSLQAATEILDATLASYSQVIFSTSRVAAILILVATSAAPRAGMLGLAGVLLGNLLATLAGIDRREIGRGIYGVNGLLLGLAFSAWFAPSPAVLGGFVAACVASVGITAFASGTLGHRLGLPTLSIPFHVVFYAALTAARALPGVEWAPLPEPPVPADSMPLMALETAVRSLGAIFFVQGVVPGALVTLAMLIASRAGFLLVLLGLFVGLSLSWIAPTISSASCPECLGANCALIALAAGSMFFVTSARSTVLAMLAVGLAAAIHLWVAPALLQYSYPALFLPFNLVALIVAGVAGAARSTSGPRASVFAGGSSEEIHDRHAMRLDRFGWTAPCRLSLPFMGRWRVTQGWNQEPTHRGLWSHGWDFEVFASDGRNHEGDGTKARDYLCFGLPVLSPGDGVVVHARGDVEENAIGEENRRDNWGNCVVIAHGPGFHSLLAHLATGSLEVSTGQRVRRGETIARCGNTGRSPVPHLHVQFQTLAGVGAPTVPAEFHDIAVGTESRIISGHAVPSLGEEASNPRSEPSLRTALSWVPGEERSYRINRDGASAGIEKVRCEISPDGETVLRSDRCSASLVLHDEPPLFLCLEKRGGGSALLDSIYLGLTRVHHGARCEDSWSDRVLSRPLLPAPLSWLASLGAPLGLTGWRRLRFSLEKSGTLLAVTGESGSGADKTRTRCELDPDRGLSKICLESARHKLEAVLEDES